MNYEDIILLVKAGYTRDQIAAMRAQNGPAQEPAPTPEPTPATTPEPTPAIQPGNDLTGLTQMLTAEFAKLNDAIVKANLQQAQQPPLESVDDILASIINPPQKRSGTQYSIKEVKS